MKKLLAFFAIVLIVGQAGAQSTEYLQHKDFQVEKKKIYDGINSSKKQLNDLKKEETKIAQSIDSIKLTLEMNGVQLFSNSDSITKTNLRVNSLKDQFDHQKMLSRGFLILLFVIILLLFIIVFFILSLMKGKLEKNRLALADLDKQTHERLDREVEHLKGDLQNIRDAIHTLSTELSHKISTGYITLESKYQHLENIIKEDVAGIEVKISTIGPEIKKVKEEQSQSAKDVEEKLQSLKREADLINQGFTLRAAKLEEEFKLLKVKP